MFCSGKHLTICNPDRDQPSSPRAFFPSAFFLPSSSTLEELTSGPPLGISGWAEKSCPFSYCGKSYTVFGQCPVSPDTVIRTPHHHGSSAGIGDLCLVYHFHGRLQWSASLVGLGIWKQCLGKRAPIHPAFARKNIEHSSFTTSLKLRYRCGTQALQIRTTCPRLYLSIREGVSCRSISLVDTETELPSFQSWDYWWGHDPWAVESVNQLSSLPKFLTKYQRSFPSFYSEKHLIISFCHFYFSISQRWSWQLKALLLL